MSTAYILERLVNNPDGRDARELERKATDARFM